MNPLDHFIKRDKLSSRDKLNAMIHGDIYSHNATSPSRG